VEFVTNPPNAGRNVAPNMHPPEEVNSRGNSSMETGASTSQKWV